MTEPMKAMSFDKIECCPTLERKPVCDRIDVRYQLPLAVADSRVNLIYHFRLERCSGPLALGDLAYTTTLLPGEKVRLFTSDRHNRWSFDSSTQLAYRHETTSEESFFTFGMARAMSDLTVNESGSSSSSYDSDWAGGGGGASLNLGIIKIGGGGGGGSYDDRVERRVRARPVAARRGLVELRRRRRARLELHRHRRGGAPQPRRGRVGVASRVLVAGLQQPQPVSRRDLSVLQDRQVPADPLPAGGYLPQLRRRGGADHRRPASSIRT